MRKKILSYGALTLFALLFLGIAISKTNASGYMFQQNTIDLEKGYNFISVPYQTPDRSIGNLFGDFLSRNEENKVKYWDESIEQWVEYKNSDTLKIADGIWVKSADKDAINVTGYDISSDLGFINIHKGWNAIGSPISETIKVKDINVIKGDEIYSYEEAYNNDWIEQGLSYFDGVTQGMHVAGIYEADDEQFYLNETTEVVPGKGYWLWSKSEDPLLLVFDRM